MTVRDERFDRVLGAGAPLVAAVFDALPDAIGVVWPVDDGAGGVDFEVGYTNPSADRMMGVPLSTEVGARLREVMPGVVEMGLFDRLLRVSRTGEVESDDAAHARSEVDEMCKRLLANPVIEAYSIVIEALDPSQ